jgi:hypothetical protein
VKEGRAERSLRVSLADDDVAVAVPVDVAGPPSSTLLGASAEAAKTTSAKPSPFTSPAVAACPSIRVMSFVPSVVGCMLRPVGPPLKTAAVWPVALATTTSA